MKRQARRFLFAAIMLFAISIVLSAVQQFGWPLFIEFRQISRLDSKDASVRSEALRWLVNKRSERVVPKLLEIFRSDLKATEVPEEAWSYCHKEIGKALIELGEYAAPLLVLEWHDDLMNVGSVRGKRAQELVVCTGEEALPPLLRCIDRHDTACLQETLWVLTVIGAPARAAEASLLERAARESGENRDLIETAVKAIRGGSKYIEHPMCKDPPGVFNRLYR